MARSSVERKFVTAFLLSLAAMVTALAPVNADVRLESPRYKILHIMSYHSPWRWTDDQFQGFKDGLGVSLVDYHTIQMDTKRFSTPEEKERVAEQALRKIAQWRPDLIYATDDDAQEYVVSRLVNSDVPIVFSGLNKAPSAFGFAGSHNITGVFEKEHFAESVKLLQAVAPGTRKFAVVFDDAQLWHPLRERLRSTARQLDNMEVVAWDSITTFAEFKQRIVEYHDFADALVLVGIFNFKDDTGTNVPYNEVLKWVAENSSLPDLSFWLDRVHYGTLASVTVSAREQGLLAGTIARSILVDGKPPGTIPFMAPTKGIPAVSLARAKKLNLKIKSSILLSTQVIQQFEWDK